MRSDTKIVSRKVVLMLAVMSSILAAVTLANAQPDGKATPFTGVWETVAGSATRYTVRLTQTGNKVTGSYSPRNGKIIGGVVVGNKVSFKWTQDGGWAGTGEFTLDDDRKGFSGSATAIKPSVVTHSWKTYRPDPPSVFTGTWAIWKLASEFSTHLTLSIIQNGDKVIGTYPAENGTIEGTVSGRLLSFKWKSDAGNGSGQFNMSSFGPTFGGWFNEGDNPDVEGIRWQGKLISDGKSRTSRPSTALDPAPGSAPVSFSGCWRLSGGMIPGQTICLKQDEGGRVTDGDRFEGTISGNTLRFTHRPGGDSRSGRLVMDKGGKSFKGFWQSGDDTELEEFPCTGIMVHTPLGKTPPATFAGSWYISEGGLQGAMSLTQSGPKVTGIYGTNQGSYLLADANVNGTILRFRLVPTIFKTGGLKVGQVVMDPDGKSFRGAISGVPVTGKFERP